MYREVFHTQASEAPLKVSDPLHPPSFEQVVYWIARTVVALVGLGAIAFPMMVASEHPRSWSLLIFSLVFGLSVGGADALPEPADGGRLALRVPHGGVGPRRAPDRRWRVGRSPRSLDRLNLRTRLAGLPLVAIGQNGEKVESRDSKNFSGANQSRPCQQSSRLQRFLIFR